MLDFSHIPNSSLADVQVFRAYTTVAAAQWQTWRKPRGKSMFYAVAVGGGAGGGGGFGAAAGTARGGGGGGGSSALTKVLCPLMFIPDTLYISVAIGGAGGAAGAAGGSGMLSHIAFSTISVAAGNVLISSGGSTVATGGGAGSATAGGTAGGANTVFSLTSGGRGSDMGFIGSVAGNVGAVGGAHTGAAGGAVSAISTVGVVGGSGGGGTTSADFAGGGITAVAGALLDYIKPLAAAAGGNPGQAGFPVQPPVYPQFAWPGLGGGASNTVAGGRGGNGGPGAGGGGGGGGVTTGGAGGRGGDGLIVIVCW